MKVRRRFHKQLPSSVCERCVFQKIKFGFKQLKLNKFTFDVKQLKMNKFIFDVKQLNMDKFIKSISQLIFSTSSYTLEVPSLRPC